MPQDWRISHRGNQKAGIELEGVPTCKGQEEGESPAKDREYPSWEEGKKTCGMAQKPRGKSVSQREESMVSLLLRY